MALYSMQACAQDQGFVEGQFDLDWQRLSFPAVSMGTPTIAQQSLTAFGSEYGISAGMPLSKEPGAFTFSWSGTRFDVSGHSSSTSTLANSPFILEVGSPSPGEIDLSYLTDPSGATAASSVTFVDRAGSPASIFSSAFSPTGPNSVTQYAVSKTALGAAFAAVLTNGSTPSAAAYGAFGDSNGLLFAGANDAGPGTVHAWSFVHVTGYTQSIWFSKPLAPDDAFALRIGATYRSAKEHFGSGLAFDLSQGAPSGAIPVVGLNEAGSFNTESGGPTIGFQGRFWPQAPFVVEMSGMAGIAYFGARSTTSQTLVLPQVAAIEVPGGTQRDNGVMGLAGLDLSLAFPLKQQVEFRLSGGVHTTLWGPRPTATGIGRTTSSQYNVGLSLTAHF
ncbi:MULTISPECIES: hypothetical protein [unclassified Rhizobium]|uniref:hypothetical protein n=1 Tax=unclassified Rhizobium TaxID=2613769 RepID=UPI003812ECB2